VGAPEQPRPKWARVLASGTHGLRRGAWYLVVNDSLPNVVIVDVRKTNVPVPRSMLEIRDEKPALFSVVRWQEGQRGARRASQESLGLTYAVCPACGERSAIESKGASQLRCGHCGGSFGVDWDHPC
jgi:hypothetical protein